MNEAWEPCDEPWRSTVWRTGAIAAAIGLAGGLYQRQIASGVLTAIVALWFTLGGHYAEVLFRKRLRSRLRRQAMAQVAARLLYWFAVGAALTTAAFLTLVVLTDGHAVGWRWWVGGLFFVGLELMVHALLQVRGRPNFYDGRG